MRASRGCVLGVVLGLVLGLTAGFGVAQQGGDVPLPEVAFLATAWRICGSTVARNGGSGVVASTVSGFGQVIDSTVHANRLRGVAMCGGTLVHSNVYRNAGDGVQSGCGGADLGYGLNAIRLNGGQQVQGGRIIACNVIQGAVVCP